jgi:CheY-like chemotaxis protein
VLSKGVPLQKVTTHNKLGAIEKNAEMRGTVVVVDDDENFRFALILMLQLEGFEVVGEAADGFEAVDVTEAAKPSFVIIDTMLPGRDGEEAAALIRTRAPGSKIIASSGFLRSTPTWADAFADKTDVAAIAKLLRELAGEGPPDGLRGRDSNPQPTG